MSPLLTLRVALVALLRNKLRTVLTMLGIIIGVATVVALMSMGSGAQEKVMESALKRGLNTVEIRANYRRGRGRGVDGNANRLTIKDWQMLSRLPEVKDSYPTTTRTVEAIYGSSSHGVAVNGTTNSLMTIQNWDIKSGREFSQEEMRIGANVIILGSHTAKELFGSTDPIGERIKLGNAPFRVIGVLTAKGGTGWGNPDDIAFTPYKTMSSRIAGTDNIATIVLQAHDEKGAAELAVLGPDILNRRSGLTDPKFPGYLSRDRAAGVNERQEGTKTFTMMLGGIASISLLVGGVGIMNIMLVSVTERIREIGIRMAVGARGRDILTQFILEAVLISVVGGGIGIALGAGVSYRLAQWADWPFVITNQSIAVAFFTSMMVGVFFGFYPAYQASKLDPIQALRK